MRGGGGGTAGPTALPSGGRCPLPPGHRTHICTPHHGPTQNHDMLQCAVLAHRALPHLCVLSGLAEDGRGGGCRGHGSFGILVCNCTHCTLVSPRGALPRPCVPRARTRRVWPPSATGFHHTVYVLSVVVSVGAAGVGALRDFGGCLLRWCAPPFVGGGPPPRSPSTPSSQPPAIFPRLAGLGVTAMAFLGCHINLVSNMEIRYTGAWCPAVGGAPAG